MNDDEKTLMLLQTVRIDGNINHLVSFGWSYVDILNKLDDLRKQGIVEQTEGGITLTSLGKSTFHSINRKLGRKGLYKYLMPFINSRITQLRKEDIYIPRKETIKEIENAN